MMEGTDDESTLSLLPSPRHTSHPPPTRRALAGIILHTTWIAIGLTTSLLCGLVSFPLGVVLGLITSLWAAFCVAVSFPPAYTHCLPRCSTAPSLRTRTRLLLYALAAILYVWCGLLLLIRIASPSPHVSAFPSSCRGGEAAKNCARVVPAQPLFGMGTHTTAHPLVVRTPRSVLHKAVTHWINSHGIGDVLKESPGFLHARFLTSGLGFADDLYAGVVCNGTQAVLSLQGQARLGVSDFGVNGNRIAALLSDLYLDTFPAMDCV